MTPFTEILEYFAEYLPGVDGTCINAESELEAVGMAWGALAGGARAATGSTGQGLSLMQESFSEITLAGLPLVIFNMARGQGDYFQSTRGGGHGDYRHLVLAPVDITETVELARWRFHLADRWRNPVLLFGDYYLAARPGMVAVTPIDFGPLPGQRLGRRRVRDRHRPRRLLSPLGLAKAGAEPIGSRPTCGAWPPSRPRSNAGASRATRPVTSTTPRPSSSPSAPRPASCASVVRDLRADGRADRLRAPHHLVAVPDRADRGARPPRRAPSRSSSSSRGR